MLKLGRLYYTSKGFYLFTLLFEKNVTTYLHEKKSWINLHSSLISLLHLWKVSRKFQTALYDQINLLSPLFFRISTLWVSSKMRGTMVT